MSDTIKDATLEYAVRLGDDANVLGHRISEWVSRGPFLEEDIAYANVALDYIGRARMFYGYAAELANDGRTEDDFAYMRDDRQYQNLLLMELPREDFAYSQVRQLFIDIYYGLMLPELVKSKDDTLAAIAAKAIKETRYHLRRSRDWVLRLGDGTEESHRRTQRAVDSLWGYTHEMFEMDDTEQRLADSGIGVDITKLRDEWHRQVSAILAEATLNLPEDGWAVRGGRIGYHTENLGHLLTEMQFVHRSYPGCQW
ncbi:phenylacetate-CoA oxygenase subunit PaaC [Halomonas campisalis]|uniref:Phenylacetate-CoA oxygenase subunit PaaC n=1 Tax=Billgrantia campisalis TaxID=74661 RepID=A0ABS9P4U2_9GAMM|nr:1,2-phenylacetyl-CoA epoxidase subunit PaaC [Halomonas campisalis]MCG6656800.1 phenylacetate-CoA oxygenase subunit PaaC [Halomonas campisalis]MDR5861989.1 phenylacetate-CoA oxygenase subunit PaaC [Halomonas campisalis]